MIDAGIFVPYETTTDWKTKAFPVVKGNDVDIRLVGDFRGLNAILLKLLWQTELSDQLLGRIQTDAKVFCMINAPSGFHQVEVDKEASKLLTIVTNMGRFSFTVMPQGVCNSSALWNILKDCDSRIEPTLANWYLKVP